MTLEERAIKCACECCHTRNQIGKNVHEEIILRHLREAVAQAAGPQPYGQSSKLISGQVAAGNPAFVEVGAPVFSPRPGEETRIMNYATGDFYQWDGKRWKIEDGEAVAPEATVEVGGLVTETVAPEVIVE